MNNENELLSTWKSKFLWDEKQEIKFIWPNSTATYAFCPNTVLHAPCSHAGMNIAA